MADVFLSYASDDSVVARRLAEALEADGRTVWWDRHLLAGQRYQRVIEEELARSQCAIVIWTAAAVNSPWVGAEAEQALQEGKLVPVICDSGISVGDIPLPFRYVQTVNLANWKGAGNDNEFRRLTASIDLLLGHASVVSQTDLGPDRSRARPRKLPVPVWVGIGVGILVFGVCALLIASWLERDEANPRPSSGTVVTTASNLSGESRSTSPTETDAAPTATVITTDENVSPSGTTASRAELGVEIVEGSVAVSEDRVRPANLRLEPDGEKDLSVVIEVRGEPTGLIVTACQSEFDHTLDQWDTYTGEPPDDDPPLAGRMPHVEPTYQLAVVGAERTINPNVDLDGPLADGTYELFMPLFPTPTVANGLCVTAVRDAGGSPTYATSFIASPYPPG